MSNDSTEREPTISEIVERTQATLSELAERVEETCRAWNAACAEAMAGLNAAMLIDEDHQEPQ